jgi:4,5-dihydroxyphthalate decarboxylase
MALNPRTRAIFEGKVAPDGVDFICSELFPSELFWRQLRFGDFDVSEFSFSELMMVTARGDRQWIGLPIFTTRRFFHVGMMVRRDRGIDSPADLKGKKLGVPEYQQTAALWTRGILQHEFGVSPSEIEFWMERNPDHSHAAATGFSAPPGVTIHQIPPEKNIGSMVVSGELDGALHYIVNSNLVDRSTIDLARHPEVKMLFPDPVAEGVRYYRETGIFPINHGMAIRRDLHERHPWLALNIFKAFQQANAIANRERLEHVEYHLASGLLPADAGKALATPLVEHGIRANRKTLETAARYSLEQGLTPRLMTLGELFAPSTLED